MFLEMRLRQLKVALLVPDDSLLRIALAKKYFSEQCESLFILDKYCHLMACSETMALYYWPRLGIPTNS